MIRRQHSKDLKFKVALEAIRGDLTIAQIVSKYGVGESLVHRWKKQLLDQGSDIFSKDPDFIKNASASIHDLEKLHSRNWKNQQAEAHLICCLLNKMTQAGMPKSVKVA